MGTDFSGRRSYRLSLSTRILHRSLLLLGSDPFRVCYKTKDHFSLFFLPCGEGRKQPLGCFLFVLQRKQIELWFWFFQVPLIEDSSIEDG